MDQQEAVDELLARHDQHAGARSLVWWTQPKLALIALAGNAVALAGVMLTVPSGGGRLVLLAGIQAVLVAAYRLAFARHAQRHLAVISFGDQVSGYAGFVSATRFEMYFRRSLAKCSKAEAAGQ